MTKRKLTYNIIYVYRGNAEVVDNFETKTEARKMAAEYQLAYGRDCRVYVKSVYEVPEEDYKPAAVIAY